MDPQQSYSEEVYEILREFLPQIEKQIVEELDSKYRKIYEEKLAVSVRQLEDESRKYSEHLSRTLKERELQIKLEYERMLDEKIRQIEANNEEALRRFKNQVREKRAEESSKDQQLVVLQQQKQNWQRLQKQYQKALRELQPDENRPKASQSNRGSNSKDKTQVSTVQHNSYEQRLSSKANNTSTTLKIDIPKERKLDIEADMGRYVLTKLSDLFRKDDNASDYSSLLSPPHIEAYDFDRKRAPVLSSTAAPTSQKKKSVFWNDDKKKELLDMIRKRIM